MEQSWVGEAWLRELLKVRKDQQEIEIWDEGRMEEEEWCQRDKGKERGYKLLTKHLIKCHVDKKTKCPIN